MDVTTVTSKGQLTIPREVRDSLGLRPGDRVAFRVRPDRVAEMRSQKVDLMSLCGVIKPQVRGVSIEEMNEAIRKAASKT